MATVSVKRCIVFSYKISHLKTAKPENLITSLVQVEVLTVYMYYHGLVIKVGFLECLNSDQKHLFARWVSDESFGT